MPKYNPHTAKRADFYEISVTSLYFLRDTEHGHAYPLNTTTRKVEGGYRGLLGRPVEEIVTKDPNKWQIQAATGIAPLGGSSDAMFGRHFGAFYKRVAELTAVCPECSVLDEETNEYPWSLAVPAIVDQESGEFVCPECGLCVSKKHHAHRGWHDELLETTAKLTDTNEHY